MQLQVTDGYITGYAVVGGFPDGIEVPDSFLEELEPEKIGYYKYEGGKAILDEEKYAAYLAEKEQGEASQSEYIPSEQESMIVMVKAMLPTMEIKDDNTKLAVSGLYEVWEPGKYEVGEIRNWYDQTWECFQAHDNAVYPDIKPDNPAWFTFWRPLHGKTKKTARPFVPVQGAHDRYHTGEYAWYEGVLYECVQDTNFSPKEYPQGWKSEE